MPGRKKIVLLCSLAFSGILAAQQTFSIPVTIRVSDPLGAVIAHAQIRVDPSPQDASANLETCSQGWVSVRLKPAVYNLSVTAAGFKPASEPIGIGAADGESAAGRIVSVVLRGTALDARVAYPSDALLLSGDQGRTSLGLAPADFHALPHITITVHNAHTNAQETYSGVPLPTLLAKIHAPMGNALRGKAMTTYVTATGSDGYTVVLSLAEVDPDFHANQIIVADARDGRPLGKNGPFQLIVPGDKRPARWVHNLVSIALQHAQ